MIGAFNATKDVVLWPANWSWYSLKQAGQRSFSAHADICTISALPSIFLGDQVGVCKHEPQAAHDSPLGQVGHEQGQWAPGCPGRCVSRSWGSRIFELICDSIMPMHFCLHSKFTSNYHQSEPRMSKNVCNCEQGHSYILTRGSSGWSYACSGITVVLGI